MSFRINTNVSAMGAYRNLSMTGLELSKSITRLSTGLRINNGGDDPSGLIASEAYRAQLSGIDQALRNNQDALNYAKTAEGGLDEVNRLLRDARSLAVANGSSTLDATQKQANQTQLNNILASIDRIASETSFGSQKLLNGAAGTDTQVIDSTNFAAARFGGTFNGEAVNVNDSVDVQVTTAAEQASVTTTFAYAAGTTDLRDGTFSVNGVLFDSTGKTRDEMVTEINSKSADTGVTASVDGSNMVVFTSSAYGSDAEVNLVDTGGIFHGAAATPTAASDTGVDAVATVTYNGDAVTFDKGAGLELKDKYGNSITLRAAGNTVTTHTDDIRVNAGSAKFQIGGNAGQTASLSIGNFSSASLGFTAANSDITGSDMTSAIEAIDAAIEKTSNARGEIGSFMKNTIESNVRSLGVARENLAATESAIRDVDVAQEMTNYTKLQILQQSGLAMLSQANMAPQSVLSLLG